ncbi:MAG: S9 family peptidase [Gemmatimonadota bacterium]
MLRALITTAPILALLSSDLCAQATRRPLRVEDALRVVQAGEPQISPDGSWVLYPTRELAEQGRRWQTRWWAAPAAGGPPRLFLQDPAPSHVRFSPDGRTLSFQRDVGGTSQIFLMPLDGGEARQLTRHATAIEDHEWAGDGSAIVFLAPDAPPPSVDEGDDAWFVDEGPNTENRGVWKNLFLLDPREGTVRQLTHLEMHVFEFEVSPRGDRVLLVARASSNRNDIDQNEIWQLVVDTGALTQLTRNGAVEDRLQWAPDGRRISWMADDTTSWTHKADKIWEMDLTSGRTRLLSGGFSGRISRYWWSPDGSQLYFSGLERTASNAYALDVAAGAIRRLTNVEGDLDVTDMSADRSWMVYSFADATHPPDVYTSAASLHRPVRITDLNPWVTDSLELASVETVRWRSRDGLEIEGLLHLPRDGATGAHPLLLQLHGGPPGFWDNTWWPQPHVYTGMGYAVFSPNVRGSDGYGDAFREAITFAAGEGIGRADYDDLMTGLDALIQRGVADPERIGVRGWSYGAILGGYALTRTGRFRAASLGAGVYDWPAEFGMGYNWDVTRWYIGGSPWSQGDAWDERSTITHADRITTPVLLIHGMNDHTTSEPQSMMLYAALRSLDRAPVRYLRVPRETHGFSEPKHIERQWTEELQWMERWLRTSPRPAGGSLP